MDLADFGAQGTPIPSWPNCFHFHLFFSLEKVYYPGWIGFVSSVRISVAFPVVTLYPFCFGCVALNLKIH